MGKGIRVDITFHIGRYKETFKVWVPKEYVERFLEVCEECDPNDPKGVKDRLAHALEETVNRFIKKAYRGSDPPARILARTLVYLATELVLAEEALKNAEGGRIL